MKENQELKGDNIVNDDKLEKEVTEGQENGVYIVELK